MKLVKPNKRELGYIGVYIVMNYLFAGIKPDRTTKSKIAGCAVSAGSLLTAASLGHYRD